MITNNTNQPFQNNIQSLWYQSGWAWLFIGILLIALGSSLSVIFFSLKHKDVEIQRTHIIQQVSSDYAKEYHHPIIQKKKEEQGNDFSTQNKNISK